MTTNQLALLVDAFLQDRNYLNHLKQLPEGERNLPALLTLAEFTTAGLESIGEIIKASDGTWYSIEDGLLRLFKLEALSNRSAPLATATPAEQEEYRRWLTYVNQTLATEPRLAPEINEKYGGDLASQYAWRDFADDLLTGRAIIGSGTELVDLNFIHNYLQHISAALPTYLWNGALKRAALYGRHYSRENSLNYVNPWDILQVCINEFSFLNPEGSNVLPIIFEQNGVQIVHNLDFEFMEALLYLRSRGLQGFENIHFYLSLTTPLELTVDFQTNYEDEPDGELKPDNFYEVGVFLANPRVPTYVLTFTAPELKRRQVSFINPTFIQGLNTYCLWMKLDHSQLYGEIMVYFVEGGEDVVTPN